MPKHPLIRAAQFPILLVALLGWFAPALGDVPDRTPPSARRLILTGSESVLWLIAGEWDGNQEEFNRRFLYRDSGSDRIHAVAAAPQAQRIGSFSTAGHTLHVFFQQGAHVRFSKTRRWRGHQLPGSVLPLALAGESRGGLSRLWAIVPAETAADVDAAWRERQARTSREPESSRHAPSEGLSISTLPMTDGNKSKAARIVFYDGVAWQPGIPMPDAYTATEQVWLAVANGRFHLFWVAQGKPEEIRYATYENESWSLGASLAAPGPMDSASVAVMNKQLVFAGLVKQPDLASVRCMQWSRAAATTSTEPWDEATSLLDEQGGELVMPTGSALGLFSDRVAVMRFGEGEPELGLWAAGAGGKPDQAFQPIPSVTDRESLTSRRGARDLAATLIVAAVLLMLFWRRQETIASPLELPVDLQVAGPARRGLAFLIDAAPAAAIVLWIWYDPITAFYREINVAAHDGEPLRDPPSQILWAWFWFRVIYTTYSICFETMLASTPGKRLMGCFVLSESLSRATFFQIAIRNVSRIIELEPFLKIWPFMLIIFFTRNRQRLGDLLARTVVVERQASVAADEQGEDDPSEA